MQTLSSPAGALCLALLAGIVPFLVPPAAAQESAAAPMAFDIPAQPLDQAVTALARLAGLTIGGDSALLRGRRAPAVQGRYTPQEALRILLAGSGVAAQFAGDSTVTLTRVPARDGDGALHLGPIQVTGDQLPVSTANAGETTTATRFPIDSREVPRSVGVVGQELIDQTNSERDLGDLSSYVSGVSREPDLVRSGSFFIRGFSVGVRATTDGLRNPRGTESARSFNVTDLALFERVEFLKGASAILYGQGEPGGNVNFVSKKPLFEHAHSIEAGISRDDYYRGVFDTTGPISDDVAYRVIGIAQNQNTPFVNPTQDDRLILNPSILWRTPNGGSVYFDYEYNDAEVNTFGANAILINGEVTEFATHDPVHDFNDELETRNLRLHIDQPIVAGWSLALDTAYSTQNNDTNQAAFWSVDDPFNSTSASGFAFFQDRTDDGFVIRPELRGEFDLGNTRHRLAIGYMYNEYEGEFSRTRSGVYGTGSDPFNPN